MAMDIPKSGGFALADIVSPSVAPNTIFRSTPHELFNRVVQTVTRYGYTGVYYQAVDCTTLSSSCANLTCSPNQEFLAPSWVLANSLLSSSSNHPPDESIAWSLFSSVAHILGPPIGSPSVLCLTPFHHSLSPIYFRTIVRNHVSPLY